jgi:SAM-dependent methyltransferase
VPVDPDTVEVYERRAHEWIERRGEATDGLGRRFRGLVGDGPVADLGCGAGRYLPEIGRPLVGVDASAAMLALAARHDYPLVRADLEALPFAGATLAGVFARHSYLHLPKDRLGDALADLRRSLRPGGLLMATLIEGRYEGRALPGDDFAGRYFACWTAPELSAVLTGAGFADVEVERVSRRRRDPYLLATARR